MGRPEADLRLIVSKLRWEYGKDIIRTMPEFPTSQQARILRRTKRRSYCWNNHSTTHAMDNDTGKFKKGNIELTVIKVNLLALIYIKLKLVITLTLHLSGPIFIQS